MYSQFLRKAFWHIAVLSVAIYGEVTLRSVADNAYARLSVREAANIASIIMLICMAVTVTSLAYLIGKLGKEIGKSCKEKIRLHQQQKTKNHLHKESNELLFRAGLDPAEPEFLNK